MGQEYKTVAKERSCPQSKKSYKGENGRHSLRAYLLTALKFTLSLSELRERPRLSLTRELLSWPFLWVGVRMPNPV